MKRIVRGLSLTVLLVCIVVAAFILRFWHLDTVPLVNRDELAIGYNAYSLLETGKDEHGVPFPLSFQSFGDYKLPGLIYSTVLPILLFGRSVFSIRFITALMGTLTVIFAFWLVKQLRFSNSVALWTAALLAVSPWHLLGSRSAYEPVAGLFWSLLSYGFLTKSKSSFSQIIGFIVCSIISTLFYNSALLLTPAVFCIFLLSLKFSKQRISGKYFVVFMILLTYLALYWTGLKAINASRFNTTIFNQSNTTNTSFTLSRSLAKDGSPYLLTRISQLPYGYQLSKAIQGYVASFNPVYLWFTGGDNPWHNLHVIGFGNLLLYTLPFFFYGLIFLFQKRTASFEFIFVLSLLVITPLASAVTVDAPNTNRLFDFHFIITLITAIGLQRLLSLIPRYWSLILIAVGGLWTAVFIVLFFSATKDDTHPLWNAGLTSVVSPLRSHISDYPIIHTMSPAEFSYIYYAFFTPFPPADFQQHAVWTSQGMNQVSTYHTYRFESFHPLACYKMLEVSPAQLGDVEENTVFVIKNRFGEPIWKAVEKQL